MSSNSYSKMSSNKPCAKFDFFPLRSQVFLDEFKGSNDLFTEDAVQDMQEKFIEKLHKVQAAMEQRNEDLDHPYTFLLPNRISKSIAI